MVALVSPLGIGGDADGGTSAGTTAFLLTAGGSIFPTNIKLDRRNLALYQFKWGYLPCNTAVGGGMRTARYAGVSADAALDMVALWRGAAELVSRLGGSASKDGIADPAAAADQDRWPSSFIKFIFEYGFLFSHQTRNLGCRWRCSQPAGKILLAEMGRDEIPELEKPTKAICVASVSECQKCDDLRSLCGAFVGRLQNVS